MGFISDELVLAEMELVGEGDIYAAPCRCGEAYQVRA
jgi:hypothetical protein